jgi:FkbM family methyltransferase
MTKAVSVLHHREWAETEGEEKVERDMGGIDNAGVYHDKFRMLERSNTFSTRLRAWLLRDITRTLFFGAPATAQRFWLNRRDWYNFASGRFISLADPIVNRRRPYHLVQSVPAACRESGRDAGADALPLLHSLKQNVRRRLGEQSWVSLSHAKVGAYRAFEAVLMAGVNRLPPRVRLSLRAHTRLNRRLDYPEADLFIHVESEQEFWRRANSCSKEPEMLAWIKAFFRPGDVLYDVGANIGAYSMVAVKAVPNVTVYAFEPAAINYAQLCRNVYSNGLVGSVFPMPVALSDRTVLDWFNYANLTAGGAFHALGEPIDYSGHQFQPVFRQPVLSYRIDDLVDSFQVRAPTHLKIDVDGIEFRVLLGAERALARVRSVMLELNRWDTEAADITNYLARKGLVLHSRGVRSHEADPDSRTGNYLFVRLEEPNAS